MKALLWVLAIVMTSVLLVGLLTGFSYTNVEVQLHDTYYVLDVVTAIVAFSITLLLVTVAFLPFKILNDRPVLKFLCVFVTGAILFIPLMVLYFRVASMFVAN